jgi:hypothetical protein
MKFASDDALTFDMAALSQNLNGPKPIRRIFIDCDWQVFV